MLCQRNKFFCDKCSGLQEAEKRCAFSLGDLDDHERGLMLERASSG